MKIQWNYKYLLQYIIWSIKKLDLICLWYFQSKDNITIIMKKCILIIWRFLYTNITLNLTVTFNKNVFKKFHFSYHTINVMACGLLVLAPNAVWLHSLCPYKTTRRMEVFWFYPFTSTHSSSFQHHRTSQSLLVAFLLLFFFLSPKFHFSNTFLLIDTHCFC